MNNDSDVATIILVIFCYVRSRHRQCFYIRTHLGLLWGGLERRKYARLKFSKTSIQFQEKCEYCWIQCRMSGDYVTETTGIPLLLLILYTLELQSFPSVPGNCVHEKILAVLFRFIHIKENCDNLEVRLSKPLKIIMSAYNRIHISLIATTVFWGWYK